MSFGVGKIACLVLYLFFKLCYHSTNLVSRPSHVLQRMHEKNREGFGDVIGCGLRRGCISLPTHPHSWSRGEAMTYAFGGRVGGDTQPRLNHV